LGQAIFPLFLYEIATQLWVARNGHNTHKVLVFLYISFKYSKYSLLLTKKISRLNRQLGEYFLLTLLNPFNKRTKKQPYVANLIKNTNITTNTL